MGTKNQVLQVIQMIQVMQAIPVSPVSPMSPVSPVRLAHLWVDLRVLFLCTFPLVEMVEFDQAGWIAFSE